MAIPRHLLVDESNPGFYHVVSRCVRQAWLAGFDAGSGRDFEHRRDWIRDRILQLSGIFAIDTYAYAVMSNHYHVVVYTDPERVKAWSDEEVARRWLTLCPPRWIKGRPADELEAHPVFQKHLAALLQEPERLATYRARLGNLGWFMRFLNEHVARRANAEDGVTGRFWEARYRSQALLDEAAVLTCMAYVDLNPIRAGIAERPETSDHTSIQARIERHQAGAPGDDGNASARSLEPVAQSLGCPQSPLTTIAETDYLQLVDWTGRALRTGTRGAIPPHLAPILDRLRIQPKAWPGSVAGFGKRFKLAAGHWDALKAHAQTLGRNWLQGVASAKAMYA